MRDHITLFLELSRPLLIAGVILQSFLGLGIARYLGEPVQPAVVFLSLGLCVFLALAGVYLFAHFHRPAHSSDSDLLTRLLRGGYAHYGEDAAPRQTLLPPATAILSAAVSLTLAALCFFGLLQARPLSPDSAVLAGLLLLAVVLISLPGRGLAARGYAEIVVAVVLGSVVPMFMFSAIAGGLHRLVPVATLGLVFLLLAAQLALAFPSYRVDRAQQHSLLGKLGWQRGVFFHDLLLLMGFLSLAAGTLAGLSIDLLRFPLFVLPVAVLQVWQMRRIADGAPPRWAALQLTAIAIYGAVAYLLTYAFWVR